MGSVDGPEGLCAHEVTIGYHFYLAKTEVTLEQFAHFVEQTGYVTDAEKQRWAFMRTRDSDWCGDILVSWRSPGFIQTDTEPAACVSYWDALAFCHWLSEKTGHDIRLPTEAEWEYACRAGTTGDYAGNIDEMAWFRTNCDIRTYPVARKKPNAWGFYDMHGNVWEWVQDVWHMGCEGAPADGSAWLDGDSLTLTMRGGSFANPPWWLQSHIHMRNDPPCRFSYNHGFRLAMSTN
jgi:formylglycine-generating enzyme required for sulfatase activity